MEKPSSANCAPAQKHRWIATHTTMLQRFISFWVSGWIGKTRLSWRCHCHYTKLLQGRFFHSCADAQASILNFRWQIVDSALLFFVLKDLHSLEYLNSGFETEFQDPETLKIPRFLQHLRDLSERLDYLNPEASTAIIQLYRLEELRLVLIQGGSPGHDKEAKPELSITESKNTNMWNYYWSKLLFTYRVCQATAYDFNGSTFSLLRASLLSSWATLKWSFYSCRMSLSMIWLLSTRTHPMVWTHQPD